MKIDHPFKPIYNKDAKILILGSFPSVISRENAFFYMNPRNRFWDILSGLYHVNFKDASIQMKKDLLYQHHIALYDVVFSCAISGSDDSTIKDVVVIELESIIQNTQITNIYLNGTKAYQLFAKHFKDYLSIATKLPSTSPANAKYSLDCLIQEWSVLLKNN